MVDHTNGVLYTNQNIAMLSYYSVSLFILISGYLSFASNKRHDLTYFQTVARSCKRIVVAYVVATFIYLIFTERFFDFQSYINHLIHFNASGPFYYVLLYIQLMMVSPALYRLIKSFPNKYSILFESLLGILLLAICYLTTNFSDILGIYGGGGKLLGGTYLFLFYLGMIFNKHGLFTNGNLTKYVICAILGGSAYFIWWKVVMCTLTQSAVDSLAPFGNGYNPPSICFTILALSMFVFCYGLFNFFKFNPVTNKIPEVIGWLGKHTLYIFLYHKLWLSFVCNILPDIHNKISKTFVYFSIMIVFSIVMECLLKGVKRIINGKETSYEKSSLD